MEDVEHTHPDPVSDPLGVAALVGAVQSARGRRPTPDHDTAGAAPRPSDADLGAFTRAVLRRVAPAELSMTDPELVAPSILTAFDLFVGRAPGTVAVQVVPVTSSMFGPEGGQTAVDVATEDRPVLFSTVLAALEHDGLTVQRFTHPVLDVERGPDGSVRALDPSPGADRDEVLVHVEVAEPLDEQARDRVTADVRLAIDDLLAAEADLPALRERVEGLAARLEATGVDDRVEAAAFLRWLLGGNFLFVGSGDEPGAAALGVCRTRAPAAARAPVDPHPVDDAPLALRSLATSRIGRDERLAELLVADLDDDGRRRGTVRVLGLTTLRGRSERPSGTPWIRRKLAATLRRERVAAGSHDETILRSLFDSLPWDALLVGDDEWMHGTLADLIEAQQTGRPGVRLLRETEADALTVVVAVAQDDVRSGMAARIELLVQEMLSPRSIESETEMSASGMTIMSFVACLGPGELDRVDAGRVTEAVVEACRSWSELLARELSAVAAGGGAGVAQRWLGRIPPAYREATDPAVAAGDLVDLDRVDGTGRVALRLVDDGRAGWHHLRVAVGGEPLELSRFLPVLESVGLVVAEEMTFALGGPRPHPSDHRSRGGPASVLDLLVARRDGTAIPAGRTRLADAVLAAWTGRSDVDRLNELVLTADLDWEHVAVLRAYARYLAQVATGTRAETLFDALADNPDVAAALWHRFERRFRPASPDDTHPAAWDEASREQVLARCDEVVRLDQDRSLRRLLGLVDATVRTNVWARTRTDAVVLAVDGAGLPAQAHPVTWRET